jgi:hypothetical protein
MIIINAPPPIMNRIYKQYYSISPVTTPPGSFRLACWRTIHNMADRRHLCSIIRAGPRMASVWDLTMIHYLLGTLAGLRANAIPSRLTSKTTGKYTHGRFEQGKVRQ